MQLYSCTVCRIFYWCVEIGGSGVYFVRSGYCGLAGCTREKAK